MILQALKFFVKMTWIVSWDSNNFNKMKFYEILRF